jgi:hypothetical protein
MNESILIRTGRLAVVSSLVFLAACVPAQTFTAANPHKAGPRNTVVIPKREPAKRESSNAQPQPRKSRASESTSVRRAGPRNTVPFCRK